MASASRRDCISWVLATTWWLSHPPANTVARWDIESSMECFLQVAWEWGCSTTTQNRQHPRLFPQLRQFLPTRWWCLVILAESCQFFHRSFRRAGFFTIPRMMFLCPRSLCEPAMVWRQNPHQPSGEMIQKLSADNQHVQQQQVTLELEFVYRLQCPSWDTVICTQTPTPMSPAAAGHADCLLTIFESFHQKVGADSAFKPSLVRTESGGIKTSSLVSWRIRLSWRICEKIGTILLKSPSIIIWLEGIVEVAEITLDVGGFE